MLGANSLLTTEMVVNNLGFTQNLSTTFRFSLNKSMEEFPNLELCNIVLQDVNCYARKIHLGSPSLSQVTICFWKHGLPWTSWNL